MTRIVLSSHILSFSIRPFNTTWQTSHAYFHPYPYPQPTRGRVRHASRPTGSIHNGILGFEPFFWSRCVWGNDMSASLKFLECSYAYMLRVGGWNETDANHEYDRNAWRIWFSLEIEHCLISAMLFSQISAVTDLWGNWSHISLVLQTKRGILRNPYRKENHPPQNELYEGKTWDDFMGMLIPEQDLTMFGSTHGALPLWSPYETLETPQFPETKEWLPSCEECLRANGVDSWPGLLGLHFKQPEGW